MDLPTHDNRGFRIRLGPRHPALNANVPLILEWLTQYLEVEDVRPDDEPEQGHTDLWGIPEALTQHIFQFLSKKDFMLFRRVSRSAKSATDNSKGLLFDAYQERLDELCKVVKIRPRWGRDRGPPGSWASYKCKNRVSNDREGENGRINGYVVLVSTIL